MDSIQDFKKNPKVKDGVQSFQRFKVEEHRMYFEGFIFGKARDNETKIYALIDNQDCKAMESKFNFIPHQKP